MAQEFTINSESIEAKINQLLPSQGGKGAGIDFSASTMVIPIVDLTETAEGSSLRQDLQLAQSLTSAEAFEVSNATTTLINTTGYHSVKGIFNLRTSGGSTLEGRFELTDGTTTKVLYKMDQQTTFTSQQYFGLPFDFTVFIKAGDSLQAVTNNANISIVGSTRQIADINGNLVNP